LEAESKFIWYSILYFKAISNNYIAWMASTNIPQPVLMTWALPPSRSWSAVYNHMFSTYADDDDVKYSMKKAALHCAGTPPPPLLPQFVSTKLPAASSIRKYKLKKPISPGLDPAILTSTNVQP